jgi:hypothetical protein
MYKAAGQGVVVDSEYSKTEQPNEIEYGLQNILHEQ